MAEASDPKRWSAGTSEAPAQISALLRDAERDFPSAAELESLSRRLEPQFAARAPKARPSAWTKAKAPGIGAVLGGLGLLGIAALVALRAYGPSEVAPSSASAPVPASPAIEMPRTPETAPKPSAELPGTSNPASTVGMRSVPATSKLGEAELLERARTALTSNPERALALTRQHQLRFPSGILKQEREVIAIGALRRLGRAEDAERRAGTFEKQYPDSAHRRAVETGLGK